MEQGGPQHFPLLGEMKSRPNGRESHHRMGGAGESAFPLKGELGLPLIGKGPR